MATDNDGCAACIYNHKSCPPCFLKQFFPKDRKDDYEAVHKNFGGASRVAAAIKNNAENKWQYTVDYLVGEAKLRQKTPDSGAWVRILELEEENRILKDQKARGHGCNDNPQEFKKTNDDEDAVLPASEAASAVIDTSFWIATLFLSSERRSASSALLFWEYVEVHGPVLPSKKEWTCYCVVTA